MKYQTIHPSALGRPAILFIVAALFVGANVLSSATTAPNPVFLSAANNTANVVVTDITCPFSPIKVGFSESKAESELLPGNKTTRMADLDGTPGRYLIAAAFTTTRSDRLVVLVPDTSITSGPIGSVSSTSGTFGFSSNDATATFECALDGTGFAACTTPRTYSNLPQGPHTFQVRAIDIGGNPDPTPAQRTWTVDTIAPDTSIMSGPSGSVSSTAATFDVTSNEGSTTFECSLDGAGFAACTSPNTYNTLSQGPHSFLVRAIDSAGNVDATPASRSWTVDTIAPDTSITSGPSGSVTSTTATFTFTSSDATAIFECSLDGSAFTSCTSPGIYNGLSAGPHSFGVRSVDTAGNFDTSPASRSWTIVTVFVWDAGGANQNWDTAANWSPNGVPGPNDAAVLNTGANINLNGSFTVQSVEMSAGSLSGGHTLTTTQSFTWTAGQIAFSARVVAPVGSTVNISGAGAKTLGGGGIGDGYLTINGTGTISGTGLGIGIGLLLVGGDVGIDAASVGASDPFRVASTGTLTKTGAGTTTLGNFQNQGAVNVSDGTLVLAGGGGAPATSNFSVSPGATLRFSGGQHNYLGATTFAGGGALEVTGGTLNLPAGAGTLNLASLALSGGTLSLGADTTIPQTATLNFTGGDLIGAGDLVVHGPATFNGGRLVLSGTLTVAATSTLTLNNAAAITIGSGGIGSGTLNVLGTANVTGAGGFNINNTGAVKVSGVLDVQSGATFATGADSTFAVNAGGTLRKTAGSATLFTGPAMNAGTVSAQSGTLQFNGGLTQTGGSMLLNGGALATTGTFNIQGGELRGAGNVTGNVNNTGGAVRPGLSPGCLNISGNYTQGAGAALDIEIGGSTVCTGFDRIAVTGAATLGGTLNLILTGGFNPLGGTPFQVLTYGSRTGTFSNVNGPFMSAYNANDLTVTTNTQTFTVVNTNDSGPGSLRQAIIDSNNTPDRQIIAFNIPGSAPFTITPLTNLPSITDSVILDGTTQPGYSGSPMIELRGNGDGDGYSLSGSNSIIKGFSIHRFETGITLRGDGGHVVQGNYIGLDPGGENGLGNETGVFASSNNNIIGGVTPLSRNVITLNTDFGIRFRSPYTLLSGNVIQGNSIGLKPNGSQVATRTLYGISVRETDGMTIGGIQPGEGNTISGVGTGVRVYKDVFDYLTPVDVAIRGNSIYSNDVIGIDLGNPGVNPNDPGDSDFGPNDLLNYPVITSAKTFNGQTVIKGTFYVSSSPNSFDFYSSPNCGEAKTYIGTMTSGGGGYPVEFEVTFPIALTIGHFITATTTELHSFDGHLSTSEISQCQVISNNRVSISGRLTHNGNPITGAKVKLAGAKTRSTLTKSDGRYVFDDLPDGNDYAVTPEKANHDFTPLNRSYTDLQTNQTDQDFTATIGRFAVSGMISAFVGANQFPLSGVTLTLSGTESRSITSSGSVYFFTNLRPGTYTITPSKDNYVFSPLASDITITNANQQRNLFATASSPLGGRIVFQKNDVIGSINADGTSLRFLLVGTDPSLSRDGKKIAFNQNGLRVSNGDGSNPMMNQTLGGRHPEFSPDGLKIAYWRDGLRVKDVSWTGDVSIPTGDLFLGSNCQVTWLSNTRVAFPALVPGETYLDICAINLDGTGFARLTNNDVWDFDPVASPDGTKIAFIQSNGSSNTNLMVMNIDGSNPVAVAATWGDPFAWSPDGTKLCIARRVGDLVKLQVVNASGSGIVRTIYESETDLEYGNSITDLSWGAEYSFSTPTGSNIPVQAGGASVSFGGVTTAGMTTFTPITSSAAGTSPNGFVVGNWAAYEISTTAAYTSPVTVCITVPSSVTQTQFNTLSLMHNEGGVLVDRTTSRTGRTICGTVATLSPFVLAEQVDVSLPSITGLVEDSNGNPLSNVQVRLSGIEERTTETDIEGMFRFVNLTPGGNYNVQPRQTGYLFDQYSEDFINLTDENAVVFTGTQSNFSISGQVIEENGNGINGAAVLLDGAVSDLATTDANGDYTFTNLPAEGFYSVAPLANGLTFAPNQLTIDALQNSLIDVDFTASAACTFTLTPTSQDFTNAGGPGNLTVTASDSDCGWTAVSNDSWITIDSGTPGTGNGTVNYSVAANPGPARNGSISVNGHSFAVNQSGASCVTVSLPTGLTAANGSNLTVPVNVGDVTGKGITSFDFTVTFDPAVLTPAATPFSTVGTLSNGFTVTPNGGTAGTLVISGFGATPLTGSGTLINLQFTMLGSAPACSSLNLPAFVFNEGTPCVASSDGQACAANGTISGVVTYANAANTTPVPNTTLNATGATTLNTTTDNDGAYVLSGFNTGAHTVTPAKTGQVNGITSYDSALIAQHVVGLITLSGTQQTASDVSNNGGITSFDASQIAQYLVGIPNPSITGAWKFAPPNRAYPSVATNQPNQDYQAILMGEVSGNWTLPGSLANPESFSPRAAPISVTLPSVTAPSGSATTISLTTQDLSGQGILSYQFDLNFNAQVVQPQAAPIDIVGTLSDGMSVTVNSSSPGLLRIAVFGTNMLNSSGALMRLHFNVVGAPGTDTPLSISNFIFNEGVPASTSNNGGVTVSATPTAASGYVSGQILDTKGNPVEGAAIRMMGTQNRLTVSDAQGNYHFDNVETNGFYTVTPARANFSFSPSQRSFSQLGQHIEATFTAAANDGTLNPLDATEYFVRQQYVDFLGREPDEAGFNFWVNNIESCGADIGCREVKRIDTSAAFFLSIEFQQTGYLVYRAYQAAYGELPNAPVPLKLNEFTPDTQQISNGVVVLQSGWQQRLENNKQTFMVQFVQRARFVTAYPLTMAPTEFVDKLFANTGAPLTGPDRAAAIAEFGGAIDTADAAARGRALRRVAESSTVASLHFNQAFVLMEYFGYLRRNPNDPQDSDHTGYDFWLTKLNQFNGNYINAEMVKAFITSIEYRQRFAP